MNKATRRAWRRDLRALRDECPPLLDVRVRLLPGPSEHFGLANLSHDGLHFNLTLWLRIRERDGVVRRVTRQELLDSLVHEWAHVLTWASSHDLEAHDPAWGVSYSRCYQATSED